MERISIPTQESARNSANSIRVGSRKSQLALIQTNLVIHKLQEYYENNPDQSQVLRDKYPGRKWLNEFHVISLSTIGDKNLNTPLPEIGAKSLFTKELEDALIENEIDFVVHSLKDLPTTLPQGCCIGAIIKRDDPNDVIVLRKSLDGNIEPFDLLFDSKIINNLTIGTSSQRRIAMIRRCNPSLKCIDIRGNLNTRFAKLDNDECGYAAIILAKAGLDRMGWSNRASAVLTPQKDKRLNDWYYAVGQGAIAVECRSDDNFIIDLLRPILDLDTTYEVVAERSFMKKLEGGCSVPLGVRSTLWQDTNQSKHLKLECIVLSVNGESAIKAEKAAIISEGVIKMDKPEATVTGVPCHGDYSIMRCTDLGIDLAEDMIKLGCLSLMNKH